MKTDIMKLFGPTNEKQMSNLRYRYIQGDL